MPLIDDCDVKCSFQDSEFLAKVLFGTCGGGVSFEGASHLSGYLCGAPQQA